MHRAVLWSSRWANLGYVMAAKSKQTHIMDVGPDCLGQLDIEGLLVLGATCRSLRGLCVDHLVEARERTFKAICVHGAA